MNETHIRPRPESPALLPRRDRRAHALMSAALLLCVAVAPHVASGDATWDHLYSLLNQPPPEQPAWPPASRGEWQSQTNFYHARLREAFNLPPDSMKAQWPLRARYTRTDIEHTEYTIKHVVFQTRPTVWVTANLYVPKGVSFPVPAVLYMHGHTNAGKAGYQRWVASLAKKGYVVLAVDCIGMGERQPAGHNCQDGYSTVTSQAASQYLTGNNTCGLAVWDNMRAVDFLCTLTNWVDATKIGATGRSGGGSQTINLTALDPRIVCAAPVCAMCTYSKSISPGSNMCMCELPLNIRKHMEQYQVLALAAPRAAVLIGATTDDGCFPLAGAREACQQMKKIYDLFGAGARLKLVEVIASHTDTQAHREAVYGWFNFHLKGEGNGGPSPEPAVTTHASSELNCGYPAESTGTLASLAYEAGQALPPDDGVRGTTSAFETFRAGLRTTLRAEVLGFDTYMPAPCSLNAATTAHVDGGAYWKDTVTYRSQPGITLTSTLYYPKDATPGATPAIVACTGSSYVEQLAEAGYVVLAAGLRPADGAVWSDTVQAMLHTGCHVFSMRVYDLLRAADYLATRSDLADTTQVGCVATGTDNAMLGLYAAALDDRFAACVLDDPLVSYKPGAPGWSAVSTGWSIYLHLPRILQAADVAQLTALIAPRPLFVADPRDLAANKIAIEQARARLAAGLHTYGLFGAANRLALSNSDDMPTYLAWLATHYPATPAAVTTGTIDVRIAAGPDDVEEFENGTLYVTSSDLEMTWDGTRRQTIGLRFTRMDIPAGATVTRAYVQFKADETGSDSANLTIEGEATPDARAFTANAYDVTARPRTSASAVWTPPAWSAAGEAAAAQRTPDLSGVVQEIVDLPDWRQGNALVLIVTGTGKRVAEAFEGEPDGAALLHVEYMTMAGDADADGLGDDWEQAQFGGTGTADSAPDADPDGDGYSNLAEFVAGTGPKSATQYFGVRIGLLNGDVVVAFDTIALGGAGYERYAGRHYALEKAGSATGPWTAVPGYEDIIGTGQTITHAHSGTAAHGQYRAAVWLE
ncbi:MAG: acetylxylan esterase [Kiritimatiellae bacterium]|nr:acetylxylan esterase [Kiritimatiellia bacterium]